MTDHATHAVATVQPRAVAAGIPGAEWLTPANLEQGMRLADMMASTALVPDHLKKKPEDCFPILVQSLRWNMDPFAVAQATAVVRGKLCYEGKLVHAVLISMGAIEGRLSYEYSGSGTARKIVVTGTPRGGKPCSVEGTVAQWQTENGAWKRDPDTMLAYRGARVWARLYCPDAMLGVTTPDEAREDQPHDAEVIRVHDDTPVAVPVAASIQANAAPADEPVRRTVVKEADPAAAAKPAAHPAIEAARALFRSCERAQAGSGKPVIDDLCRLYGAGTPTEVAADKLDSMAALIARLAPLAEDPRALMDEIGRMLMEQAGQEGGES